MPRNVAMLSDSAISCTIYQICINRVHNIMHNSFCMSPCLGMQTTDGGDEQVAPYLVLNRPVAFVTLIQQILRKQVK